MSTRPAADRRAVALRYEANTAAPRVVAKGEGALADALARRAAEAGVPVRDEPALAALLMQLDLDTLVPPALYEAVIQVLLWAYEVADRPLPVAPEGTRKPG